MREKVAGTQAYQNLNPTVKLIIIKHQNVLSIQHNIAVIKNIGFERWRAITPVSPINLRIINELIEKEKVT